MRIFCSWQLRDNDIQACGLNDIFAVGKNDIALWATIFTLRVNGGARVLVVLYPAFRADALHAGLLADTRWGLRLRLRPPWLRVQYLSAQQNLSRRQANLTLPSSGR